MDSESEPHCLQKDNLTAFTMLSTSIIPKNENPKECPCIALYLVDCHVELWFWTILGFNEQLVTSSIN